MPLVKSVYVKLSTTGADDAQLKIAKVAASAEALANMNPELKVRIDTAAAATQLALIRAEMRRAAMDTGAPITAMTGGLNGLVAAAATGAGAFAFLATKVALFGGVFGKLPILGAVSGWHLLAQGILETAGTLIPATLAFAAFGAAAVPTVQSIISRMTNLNTINTATGASLYPLSGGFSAVANAVKPQVMLLFGDALEIAGQKTGAFAKLAQQGGAALDQLGSRLVLAVTSGKGFSQFLTGAGKDLAGWGNNIGDIFGALGNILKQLPGYAGYLLSFVGGITHLIENVTGSTVGQKIIGVGLAFHGAAVYIGLGASLISFAASRGAAGLGNLAERAGMALLATDRFGAAGARAGTALLGFSADAAGAAALPWGWIAIAAAAVGFLAYKLFTAKDATQQWVASLEQAVGAASATHGLTALMGAQLQVADRLTVAQRQLAQATRATAAANTISGAASGSLRFSGGSTSTQDQVTTVNELTAAQRQLADQTALYEYRVGKLGAIFGSTAAAIGLLNAAGIKTSDILGGMNWAQILQQVSAVAAAYQAMGQRSGVLGADLNALTIAGSDQVTAMTKLTQAWDTTIGIVSGGQGAFITFEQNLQQTATAGKAAGASMNGLSTNSLALRSAWQTSYQNGAKLIDALRMMSSASPGGFPAITPAVRDVIAQLIPFGARSAATRAELVSLVQEVQPGITSFRGLETWLGHTKDAGEKLNKILAQSGLNIQDVAKDASNLASVMNSQVTTILSDTKLKTSGFNSALSTLTNDMKTNANTSPVVQAAALGVYRALIRAGDGAQQAAFFVDSLTRTIVKVPKNASTTFSTPGLSAAMSAVQAYAALLSRVPGFLQTQLNASVGVTTTSPPGAHPNPGPPSHKTGGAMPHLTHGGHEITLRFETGDPLLRAMLQGVRAEVRHVGGGGPKSVQIALGRTH